MPETWNATPPAGGSRADRTICQHFGFAETPFTIAPDPRFLFMSERHREALAHLLYGVENGGIVMLTGEVGTGKTTVCRALLEQLPERCNVAFVVNPRLSETDFLATICDEFRIAYPEQAPTNKVLIDAINSFLLARHAEGRTCVLVVDEAQNLSVALLEQMRLLTNLETNRCKLLHIIMIGQPELRETLAQPALRQLAQRITARYHLTALSRGELAQYVRHRVRVAGGDVEPFERAALSHLHRLSRGVPRVANVVCERAMLGTAVEGAPLVSTRVLKRAAREVLGPPVGVRALGGRRGALAAGVALVVGLGAAAATGYLGMTGEGAPAPARVAGEPAAGTADDAQGGTADVTAPPAKDPATSTVVAELSPPPPAASLEDAGMPSADAPPAEPLRPVAMAVTPRATVMEAPPATASVAAGPFRVGHRDQALAALFEAWNVPPAPPGADPCTHAAHHGLSCLDATGGLTSLLDMNRPALLELIGSTGEIGYGTLRAWNADGAAVVMVDGQPVTLPLDRLDDTWTGSFTILWQPPAGYRSPVGMGDTGAVVDWLRSALARIDASGAPAAPGRGFDQPLRSAVVDFQTSHGLTPDGIAGPLTIVHLNSALSEPPRLMP